ncbi:MAG: tRNA ((37)-N6)-threonylcarbamoyltransferase complex ATPase subunit type 1 TsaE [Verrucomicrobia bacterium]|jgi:tRNA threonylcarbamoyladenosine biosynthesis protein TsaE|nr:tRNA ((37)-N6)-threonylcarbamoyltransferase complex ATPase subunit type 1 TsaE [Verrucomicrobiota bacterium]
MATCITRSPEETFALGEKWSRSLRSGDVIALVGDLGAGKTQLVKGIAAGLGYAKRVQSPTFALINEYLLAELIVYHLDLYRLETKHDVAVAGLDEFLIQPNGITLVEWPERWFGAEFFTLNDDKSGFVNKPETNVRRVVLETLSETERRLVYEDFGV